MDSGHDAETDEDSTPLMSTSDDDFSSEIQQLREENADLRQRLRRAQKKIDEYITENKNLSDRLVQERGHFTKLLHQILKEYYSVGENSVSFKEELEATQVLLLKEQENIKELQDYIDHLRTEICKTGQQHLIKLFDGIPGSESKTKIVPNGHVACETTEPAPPKVKACHRLSAELNPDDLMLSCTLCSEKMRIDEITSHSRMCSAQSQSRNRALHKPNTLIVNVTCSEADIEKASFKIVTRTNLENYNNTYYDVHRSESDCLWLRENLQQLCTECVVPPLLKQTTLNGKTRELERFLSRLCQHQTLRTNSLLQLFLTGSDEGVKTAKEEFHESQSLKQSPTEHKPSRISTSDKGTLIKCQKYLDSIVKSLSGLINHLKSTLEISSKRKKVQKNCTQLLLNKDIEAIVLRPKLKDVYSRKCRPPLFQLKRSLFRSLVQKPQPADNLRKYEGQGRWFKSVAESEPEETYLKAAAQALSKVCDDLEKGQKEDEKLIIGDLQSVLEYIYSCQELLKRVESSVNRFLYWEEEVRVCEEMKKTQNKESNPDLTIRWAEANSNYHAAKAHLEMMYENLPHELDHFDYQKELELREIFIEYTTLKFEHYEKVKSKWEAATVMTEMKLSRDNRAIVFT